MIWFCSFYYFGQQNGNNTNIQIIRRDKYCLSLKMVGFKLVYNSSSNIHGPAKSKGNLRFSNLSHYFFVYSGISQRYPSGYREVIRDPWREQVESGSDGLAQASVPQGRLPQRPEHHPDHSGGMLLCKL